MLPLMLMKLTVVIMDPRLSPSKKFLMASLPCTMSMISQTKLVDQCLGSTLKQNQPFSAQVEVDPLLFLMTMTNLMVKDILLLDALEVLVILNFLPKEKLPVLFLLLTASKYLGGNNLSGSCPYYYF